MLLRFEGSYPKARSIRPCVHRRGAPRRLAALYGPTAGHWDADMEGREERAAVYITPTFIGDD
jgi:hypothetical protein